MIFSNSNILEKNERLRHTKLGPNKRMIL